MGRLALLLVMALGLRPAAAATSARELLDHVDDLFRGRASHGQATMTVTTAHWTRRLSLEFWTQGKEHSLIRILSPEKERGTATLKVGNDLWNYLPKVNRVLKLPSSMMSASWMGSHFTNDDLVKESRMADDYDVTISFEGARDGADVTEITCLPKADAAVVWGKVLVRIRRADRLPLQVDYWDEEGRLVRTLTYRDVRALGGRQLPIRMTIVPTDSPAESTEVVWDALAFDVALPADTFTLQSLQR